MNPGVWGVCLIIRDTITTSKEAIKTYQTFECIHMKAITASVTYRFLTLYRPSPSQKNRLTTSGFRQQFDDFLTEQILAKGN